jgi:hypothetical protein
VACGSCSQVAPLAAFAEPARFRALADHLERVSTQGQHRIVAREALFGAACGLVDRTDASWRGANGEAFRRDFRANVGPARGVEPAGTAAYRGLAELAVLAREVAAAIDEADANHRNVFLGLLDRAAEIDTRLRIQQYDLVGLVSDEEAEEARRLLDRANAEREAYELRVHAAAQRWRDACQGVAAAVAAARDGYAGATIEPGPAVARHGEASYHRDLVKEDLQRGWISSAIAPFLAANRDDPKAIKALWGRLTTKERDVLMRRRPDLIVRYFFELLDADESLEFFAINRYSTRQRSIEGAFDITVPLKVLDLDIHGEAEVVLRATFNSDGSVDAYTSMTTEGRVELGFEIVTAGVGVERRLGYTVRFATEAEFWAAHERLREAIRRDGERPTNLGGETRQVIADVFGGTEQGFDLALGTLGMVEAEMLQGWAPGRATGTRTNGAYYDGMENEIGVFVTGEVEARLGPADLQFALDGRVYAKEGDRFYARLTLSGDLSGSTQLLRVAGFTVPQLEAIGLGEGQQGTAAVTVTTELANANRAGLISLLDAMGRGTVDLASLQALGEGSEVQIAITMGTAQRSGLPTNPYVNAEVNVSDTTVVHSYRKTPTGEFYDQRARP